MLDLDTRFTDNIIAYVFDGIIYTVVVTVNKRKI